MSSTLNNAFHAALPMTRAETHQSARSGTETARTLAPLYPDDVFRFPIATRVLALAAGERTAAELVIETSRGDVTYDGALAHVRRLLKSKPMMVQHAE